MVVTNYNYGHFLEACLASLASQTVRPDEIIVVDDGSTDASREILARHSELKVIAQQNGGQASAFNAGYHASSSDMILFLDADDRLRPQAVETVKRLWSDELSLLSFHLGMVDAEGRDLGRYPITMPKLDRRGRLVKRLAVPFIPTSGNVFSRALLKWAFPLPETRWRISADALLVRCGLLSGRSMHHDQILGLYATHGHNNYYDTAELHRTGHRQGQIDIADAGLELLEMSARPGAPIRRVECDSIARSALEMALWADMSDPHPAELRSFQRRLGRITRQLGVSLLPYRLPPESIGWNRDFALHVRKGWPRAHAPVGPADDPGEDRARTVAIVERVALDISTLVASQNWRIVPRDGSAILFGTTGVLRLRRLTARGSLVRFFFSGVSKNSKIEIRANGNLLAAQVSSGRTTIEIALSAPAPLAPEIDEIRISVSAAKSASAGAEAGSASLVLDRMVIMPLPDDRAGHFLPISRPGLATLPDTSSAEEAGCVLESGDRISLARPSRQAGQGIRLHFGATQEPGWLTLKANRATCLHIEIGASLTCVAPMPNDSDPENWNIEAWFEPSDPLAPAQVQIASMCWVVDADPRALVPNALYAPVARRFLGQGWEESDGGTPLLPLANGELRITLPRRRSGDRPILELDLEPLDPVLEDSSFVIVVTSEDQVLAQAQLVGRGVLNVPLTDITASQISLVLQATPIPVRHHSGLQLLGLRLTGLAPEPEITAPCVRQMSSPLADPNALLAAWEEIDDPSARIRNRDKLCAQVETLSEGGTGLLTPALLRVFAKIGHTLPTRAPMPIPESTATGSDWLKWLSLSLLGGPAWISLAQVSLQALPPGDLRYANVVGIYLGASPRLTTRDDAATYADWLVARLSEAQTLLKTETDGWHRDLAKLFIEHCHPNPLLFHDGPVAHVVAPFFEAVETLLLCEGHDLVGTLDDVAEPAPAEGRKTRVAVLLRHGDPSPEVWIARALLSALRPEEFEICIYLCDDASPETPLLAGYRTVALGGQSLSLCVAEIRAWRPDVALLGAYFIGFGPVASIAAHRLAPRQIAMSAVAPSTTGMRSTNTFIAGQSVTPTEAIADYTESVMRAPGAGQAFRFEVDEPELHEAQAALRARIGLKREAVLLVSGAMREKIGPDLIRSWASILSGAPKATLALYPFAPSWLRDYDTVEFKQMLADALVAKGVDPTRLRIFAPMPLADVKRLLRAADLYLDSFPYSGATTVVEALTAGLPIVSHAGRSQRCQQGSGWLLEFGLEEWIAKSSEDYIQKATHLANSENARASVRSTIARTVATATAQRPFLDWFARFLRPDGTRLPPRYIFHHMPKAGGTSTQTLFADWFNLVPDYREPWAPTPPDPLDLSVLSSTDLLVGHFGTDTPPLTCRYPETVDTEAWRRITFVRDPLEIALSVYFFEKAHRGAHDPDYTPLPLGEFLAGYEGMYLPHFGCTADTWRETLDQYWFIGTLERLDDCVTWLAHALDKPLPEEIMTLNVTERTEKPSEADIEAFVDRHSLEFEIYREISARLSEHLGEPALERMSL